MGHPMPLTEILMGFEFCPAFERAFVSQESLLTQEERVGNFCVAAIYDHC
jgi:hypothetical protein